jgi:hypothetical protein
VINGVILFFVVLLLIQGGAIMLNLDNLRREIGEAVASINAAIEKLNSNPSQAEIEELAVNLDTAARALDAAVNPPAPPA